MENSIKKKSFLMSDLKLSESEWENVSVYSPTQPIAIAESAILDDPVVIHDDVIGEERHCRICSVSFYLEDEYRKHFKDDWHRCNLKLALRKKTPITQEEFTLKVDDLSSISGSESEHESEPLKPSIGSPKLYFKSHMGDILGIYRCILYPRKSDNFSELELVKMFKESLTKNIWGIIMLGGGHFAAAIYKGSDVILHKTFHSYTVRAKQGGSQSSRDNKSGGGSHPKSAGASLRRYNEAAFTEHVQETFEAWIGTLKQCHLIFYRAASSNQTIMFGGKNPYFIKSDQRLRSIPFPTRRATLKEVRRVWLTLASVELLDESPKASEPDERLITSLSLEDTLSPSNNESSDEELKVLEEQRFKRAQRKLVAKLNSNMVFQNLHPDSESCGMFPGEKEIIENIRQAIKKGDSVKFDEDIEKLSEILNSYKEEYHLEVADVLNIRQEGDCTTLLHIAAATKKRPDFVWKLLELGCDPSLNDALGKVPYMVAADKDIRNCFRRFMGSYPDRYDYQKAAIPSPLTDDVEKLKQEKLAEKRKQQRLRQKEKKILEKIKMEETKILEEKKLLEEEEKRRIVDEKLRFLALSDREKRALAAERRLLTNMSKEGLPKPVLIRCFLCAEDMSGKIPFEYNQNKFCSTACLQRHRKLQPK